MTTLGTSKSCPAETMTEVVGLAESDEAAALQRVEELLLKYPHDPSLHFLRGSLLAAAGRYDLAEQTMAHALRLAPGYAIVRFQLGLLQLSGGKPGQATATWAPLMRLGEVDPLRIFAEGIGHMAADRFEEAKALITRGLNLNQQNPALNRDMELLLHEIAEAERLASEGGDQVSSTQQLLQQSASKRTMH